MIEYKGKAINNFAEFHNAKIEERKGGIYIRIPVEKVPVYHRKEVLYSDELRDYYEYLSYGGPEIPEERMLVFKRVLNRVSDR